MLSSYIAKERLWVSFFLFAIFLGLAENVHKAYFVAERNGPTLPSDRVLGDHRLFIEPATVKPEAYRVAMPALGRWTMQVLHVHEAASVAAGFDLLSGFFSCYLLYGIALSHLPETSAAAPDRLRIIVLFLAFLQFPVAWIVPWQRPETLPSALYIAIVLFAAQRLRSNRAWALVIVALTALQAFVRSDVAFVMGAALLALALLPRRSDLLAPRGMFFALGTSLVVVSAAVQAYLQVVLHPHLEYRTGTPIIPLLTNFTSPHQLFNMTIALLPFLALAILLVWRRRRLDAIDQLVLTVSGLYLVCYTVFAIAGEVRVYVPFLLALCVVAAKGFAGILEPRPAS